MRSSSEAGLFKTGMITLFGASGELESGTVDFADLLPELMDLFFMTYGEQLQQIEKRLKL